MSLILSGSDGLSDIDGSAATPAIRGTDANTGIFFPAADTIAFAEGGVEAMRLTSTGDVGIGTTPASGVRLDIRSNNVATLGDFRNASSTGYGIYLAAGGSTSQYVQRWADYNNNALATIDGAGNLLVGTTSAGTDKVRFASAGASANQLGLVSTDDHTGNGYIQFRNSAATSIGSISRVGTTNAVAYNTTSDLRLKSNISDASPVLEKLMQVKVRQYDWTQGDLHQDYGFIAQELEPTLSGIVTKGKTDEDMWQLDYSRLTPHLLKAIQEQQAIITQLQADVAALKAIQANRQPLMA